MYEKFFGLSERPFQMVPDPAYLYWSDGHLMAFTMLRYGIVSASPLTVVTGDVGAGKTTLLRRLLDEFPGELVPGLMSNLQSGRGELLEWALMAFGQPYQGGHVECFERFQNFVIETYAAGKQVVLIVDEAQNLDIGQLEELRMLSNINAEKHQLLQIVLVGQPELREALGRREMRQFSQRITSDFHLAPLKPSEVKAYVDRRLEVAGAETEIFPSSTTELIAHVTRGIPRLINVLCDLCLAHGFASESKVIDTDILRELVASIERNGIFNQFTPLGSQPTLVTAESAVGNAEVRGG